MTTRRGHLSAVEDRHWCWYTTPSGAQPALDELRELKNASPIAKKAVAKILVTMERHAAGGARDGGLDKVGDHVWELKQRLSNFQIRLLFAKREPHLAAVEFLRKDYQQLKRGDIDRAEAIADAWKPGDCTGPIDFRRLPHRL